MSGEKTMHVCRGNLRHSLPHRYLFSVMIHMFTRVTTLRAPHYRYGIRWCGTSRQPYSTPKKGWSVKQRQVGWLRGDGWYHLPSKTTSTSTTSIRRSLLAALTASRTIFLPRHYPTSVTPEYLTYSIWQCLHNITGAANGGKYIHISFTQCI
jgi:hypothetical protein